MQFFGDRIETSEEGGRRVEGFNEWKQLKTIQVGTCSFKVSALSLDMYMHEYVLKKHI